MRLNQVLDDVARPTVGFDVLHIPEHVLQDALGVIPEKLVVVVGDELQPLAEDLLEDETVDHFGQLDVLFMDLLALELLLHVAVELLLQGSQVQVLRGIFNQLNELRLDQCQLLAFDQRRREQSDDLDEVVDADLQRNKLLDLGFKGRRKIHGLMVRVEGLAFLLLLDFSGFPVSIPLELVFHVEDELEV